MKIKQILLIVGALTLSVVFLYPIYVSNKNKECCKHIQNELITTHNELDERDIEILKLRNSLLERENEILLTSKFNLLLDTIISRCQIVRFRSFSAKQINSILKDYLDAAKFKINRNLEFQDLINSANGSPGQLLNNIEIWNELSDEISNKLNYPTLNSIEILEISKLINEELNINQQICLVNLIQIIWWRQTKSINLIKKLENLKFNLRKNIHPRVSWEIFLLKISMADL